jgi:hypothetical protein
MSRSSRSLGPFLLSVFAAVGCSGGSQKRSSTTPSTTTVHQSGDDTVVTIEDSNQEPVNPVCAAYCGRIAACWDSRPNNPDLMLTKDEIVGRCKKEQAECRTPTTDMLCCSEVKDCYDFNRCLSSARDVVMACERAKGLEPRNGM